MKRNRLFALLIALLMAFSVISCGAKSASDSSGGNYKSESASSGGNYNTAASTEYVSSAPSAAYTEEAMMDTADSEEEAAPETPAESISAADVPTHTAKLIYFASVDMEATDFDGACAALEKKVQELGGFFENSDLNSYSTRRYANYTVRVPQKNYRALLDACGQTENCKVLSKSENVENVSTAYFDTETRLTTLRTKLERLQTLMAQATEMEDIIVLEREISDTEYEIDLYTSTLNRYDDLIDFSTITISIDEVITLTEEEDPGFLVRLGQNFRWGAENFIDGLQDLLTEIAYDFFPLLIVIVIVILIVRAVRKRLKARKGKGDGKKLLDRFKAAQPPQTPAEPTEAPKDEPKDL